MIQLIKNLLGIGPKVNIGELIKNGAQVVDVRSRGEYSSGHLKGSVNIPLDQLPEQLKKLKNKDEAIITCCASGMRSASAQSFLRAKGYQNVHNGGSWLSLKKYQR